MRSELKKVRDALKYINIVNTGIPFNSDLFFKSLSIVSKFTEDCINEKENKDEKLSVQSWIIRIQRDVSYLAQKLEEKNDLS